MSWTAAPSVPVLREHELHVWRAGTAASVDALRAAEAVLAADERDRADLFRHAPSRTAYVVARAAFRRIVGAYLDVDPASVRFAYSAWGKPCLADPDGGARLQFNLSHSGEWAVYAFAIDRPVGVDVEQIRQMPDLMDIARCFFAASEYEALSRLEGAGRLESFFACWTRKEAYLKARGPGLSASMSEFVVSVSASEPPRLLADHESSGEVGRWAFRTVDVGPGYAGAVVVEGEPDRVRFFDI
jgi:4'-phosphopantetheinyl transferase